MFILYFGKLLKRLEEVIGSKNIGGYADDLLALIEGKKSLELVLRIIEEWAVLHKSKLNQKKTEIVVIRKNARNYPTEDILGFKVQKSYKYLGFHLDSSLTLKTQFEKLKQRVNFKI
jgi:hypothetical protein